MVASNAERQAAHRRPQAAAKPMMYDAEHDLFRPVRQCDWDHAQSLIRAYGNMRRALREFCSELEAARISAYPEAAPRPEQSPVAVTVAYFAERIGCDPITAPSRHPDVRCVGVDVVPSTMRDYLKFPLEMLLQAFVAQKTGQAPYGATWWWEEIKGRVRVTMVTEPDPTKVFYAMAHTITEKQRQTTPGKGWLAE